MDVQYLFLFQVLLLLTVYVGIRYVSIMKETSISRFLKIHLTEEGAVLYSRVNHNIGKEKIHSYDKYQMWRYIEHREEASFIYEHYDNKERVIDGDFSTDI